MLDTVFAAMRSRADDWESKAHQRREISQMDAVADTLVHCAEELRMAIEQLESESEWLTPEQYAELMDVADQTVRNWIHRGELRAERTAKGFKIPRSAQRVRLAKVV